MTLIVASARHGRTLRALASAGSALICGAAADIVHEILFQSMVTTSAVAGVAFALANLAVRLVRGGSLRRRARRDCAAPRRASANVGACRPMA